MTGHALYTSIALEALIKNTISTLFYPSPIMQQSCNEVFLLKILFAKYRSKAKSCPRQRARLRSVILRPAGVLRRAIIAVIRKISTERKLFMRIISNNFVASAFGSATLAAFGCASHGQTNAAAPITAASKVEVITSL